MQIWHKIFLYSIVDLSMFSIFLMRPSDLDVVCKKYSGFSCLKIK